MRKISSFIGVPGVFVCILSVLCLITSGCKQGQQPANGATASTAQTPQQTVASQASPAHIPFVGCPADGQAGPVAAPPDKDMVINLPADSASKLAYYGVGSFGVLAPRGWHCFETYGSDGSNLFVAPDPINSASLLSANWGGFTGPAIQVSYSSSDTSGRFAVAQVIARVFPAHMAFVKQVEAEGIESSKDFPVGPYPADTLNSNGDVVEFTTPANQDGLGTASSLKKNGSPITGVAILRLSKEVLVQLSIRLPGGAEPLGPVIIHELESETK